MMDTEPAVARGDDDAVLISQVGALSTPLRDAHDLDPLLDKIGKARFVLLGEASHGTADYYRWRSDISRRLIVEKDFTFMAVEGDWPDCYQLNRYVKGEHGQGDTAREVLQAFERWPTWMWANEEIVELAEWLRDHNEGLEPEERVGFYGLDVYSLWDSLYRITEYLKEHDPDGLAEARRAFECFDPYSEDVHEYARAQQHLVDASCEDEVVALLARVRSPASRLAQYGGHDADARFDAEQNALVVKNAEHYYRTVIRGGPESWNIRDRHMFETLERLMRHYGPHAKAVVWEHNTHVGDARFTDMADHGMINVGQLVREHHRGEGVVLVGFSSYAGTVIAAREWEAPMQRMPVPPARTGSWEEIFHRADPRDRLFMATRTDCTRELLRPRGSRAIGVVYRPERERGNYVPTMLPLRYDALIYLDETEALHPLREVHARHEAEPPETYPSGM